MLPPVGNALSKFDDPVCHGKRSTTFELRSHARHVHSTQTTCAVVGSSSSLLGQNFGRAIDRADAVFRVNLAPVKGYERDVGSRTTWRVGGVNLLHALGELNEDSAVIQV